MKRKVCKFSLANLFLLPQAMSTINWLSLVEQFIDLDTAAATFLQHLLSLRLIFSLRTIRVRSFEPKWIKASLKILIDDRDRVYQRHQFAKYYRLREKMVSHVRRLKSKFVFPHVILPNCGSLCALLVE